MSKMLNMIKCNLFQNSTLRIPSVQSPPVFARRLLTAIWRSLLLPLCVTFPTTQTFLKNGLSRAWSRSTRRHYNQQQVGGGSAQRLVGHSLMLCGNIAVGMEHFCNFEMGNSRWPCLCSHESRWMNIKRERKKTIRITVLSSNEVDLLRYST